MIEITNLSKTFRVHKKAPGLIASMKSLFVREWVEHQALKDVSLQVEPGEILGLVGQNGAGKTTLVKILSGIVHRSGGEASVLGFDPWKKENAYRKQIALIMGQKAQLWWDLPASDCFLLLREIYEIDQREYRKRLSYFSQTLEVEKLLDIPIRRLSLGERMKMELIAALLHQPRVVFLDEPTIGLDISAQKTIRRFLLEYRQTHKPIMILTSHYMDDIEQLCKRIVIIRQGEFVYDGSLQTVLDRFATHKNVTAFLKQGKEQPDLSEQLQKAGVEFVEQSRSSLQLLVPRKEVPDVAALLLQQLHVSDLKIEEEDIANIIESLMKGQASLQGAGT